MRNPRRREWSPVDWCSALDPPGDRDRRCTWSSAGSLGTDCRPGVFLPFENVGTPSVADDVEKLELPPNSGKCVQLPKWSP